MKPDRSLRIRPSLVGRVIGIAWEPLGWSERQAAGPRGDHEIRPAGPGAGGTEGVHAAIDGRGPDLRRSAPARTRSAARPVGGPRARSDGHPGPVAWPPS